MPNPNDGVIAAYSNTISTGTNPVPVTGVLAANAGVSTAGSAAALTPTFASGTAAQLTDTTKDYQIYLQFGAIGSAMSVAIGPTSTPANTIISSAVVAAGEVVSFRLPASWYAKVTFTTTTLANQAAISCYLLAK